MSANLWSDSTANMAIRADGTYLAGKVSGDLSSAVTGMASLTENQTVHIGASLRNAGAGVLMPFVEYKDAAGNTNCVGFPSWQPTDTWQRFEGTCVVPSGMTVCGVGFSNDASTGEIEVSNPVFNYGSTGIVMAAGSVTVASINDVASTTRWYLLQSSTLTAPAKPTANPPGGSWAATEPTYTEGSTNSLYTCDQTIFSDGTFAYSAVSLSSSYEASKAAYNKAAAAAAAAATTAQHFWADDSGAHVSSTGDHGTSGFHQLMTSVKNAFMHGSTELMTISESLIELGKNSIESAIKMCGGSLLIHTREVSGSPYVDGLTWIGNVSDRSNVTMRGGAAVGLTIGGSEDQSSDVWMGLQHAEAGVLDSPPVSIVTGVQRHVVSAATVSVSADSVEVSNQAMTSSATVPMSRLVALLSDTGWTWLADYGGGDGVRWRCVAGVVYVQAAIYGEHTVGAGGWDAGTIPASYRPSSVVAVPGVSFGALTNPTQLRAGSNGNVNLWAPSDTTYFGGSLSYPLEA